MIIGKIVSKDEEIIVLFGVLRGCNDDAFSPWCCNDCALGVVVVILFYKFKKRARVKIRRVERESGVCGGEVCVGSNS